MLLSSLDYDIVFTSNQLTYLGVLGTLYVLCLFSDSNNFILRLLEKYFQDIDIRHYAGEKFDDEVKKNIKSSTDTDTQNIISNRKIEFLNNNFSSDDNYHEYREKIKSLNVATENEYLTQFSFFSTLLVLFFCVVCEVLKTKSNQESLISFSYFFVFFVSLFMLFFNIKILFKYGECYREGKTKSAKQKTPFLGKILFYAVLFLLSVLIALNCLDKTAWIIILAILVILVVSVSLGLFRERLEGGIDESRILDTKNRFRFVICTIVFFLLLFILFFYNKNNANCNFWFFITAPFIVLFVGELFEPYENGQKKYAIKCFIYMIVALTEIIFFYKFTPSIMSVAVFKDIIKLSFIFMVTINCIFLPICIGYTWSRFARKDSKKVVNELVQQEIDSIIAHIDTSNESISSTKSTKSVGDSTDEPKGKNKRKKSKKKH